MSSSCLTASTDVAQQSHSSRTTVAQRSHNGRTVECNRDRKLPSDCFSARYQDQFIYREQKPMFMMVEVYTHTRTHTHGHTQTHTRTHAVGSVVYTGTSVTTKDTRVEVRTWMFWDGAATIR